MQVGGELKVRIVDAHELLDDKVLGRRASVLGEWGVVVVGGHLGVTEIVARLLTLQSVKR